MCPKTKCSCRLSLSILLMCQYRELLCISTPYKAHNFTGLLGLFSSAQQLFSAGKLWSNTCPAPNCRQKNRTISHVSTAWYGSARLNSNNSFLVFHYKFPSIWHLLWYRLSWGSKRAELLNRGEKTLQTTDWSQRIVTSMTQTAYKLTTNSLNLDLK